MRIDFKHSPIREDDIVTFMLKTSQTRQTAIDYLMADNWKLYLAMETWMLDQAWQAKQKALKAPYGPN